MYLDEGLYFAHTENAFYHMVKCSLNVTETGSKHNYLNAR